MWDVRRAHLFLSRNVELPEEEDRDRIEKNRLLLAVLIEEWAGRRVHDGELCGNDPTIIMALADRVATLTEEVKSLKAFVGKLT